MPEGDTLFRTAARLRPILQGRRIEAATAREPEFQARSLVNQVIEAVDARGKHLLIRLDDSRTIHSHLGMHGSWHVYGKGEPWRKNKRLAGLVIEVDENPTDGESTPENASPRASVCVCFNPKTLELLSETQLRRHPHLSRLGPDLLGGELDMEEVVRRFRVHDQTPIGGAVMNQTIVCGIGNIYKSEVLFMTRINPFRPVAKLSDEDIARIVNSARKWLRFNAVGGYPRRTRSGLDGASLWVYGRGGRACFRCRTRIRVRRQGDLGRTTFWCPRCQAADR
jgi:endonuclease-8